MGLFGLFGSGKITEKDIAKQVARIKERYAQTDYRKMAMEKLLDWNTPESMEAVLGRFSIVAQSPHWDEDEKHWLIDELVKRPDTAKPALQKFVKTGNEVTHAILALSKLCVDRAEFSQILIDALKARSPEDHRSGQSKMELIASFMEHDIPNLPDVLLPYLDDHNDDVQCIALDLVASKKLESLYGKIAQILSDVNRSARVLRHSANYVFTLRIPVDMERPLAPEVAEDYGISDGKLKPLHRG